MTRPKQVTITAVLMSITNAMGWLIIDWHAPHAKTRFVTYTVAILVGYVFVWFYWQGRNWARISVLVCSFVTILDILAWNSTKPGTILWPRRAVIGSEAILALFLLYWLNTSGAREYFKCGPSGELISSR